MNALMFLLDKWKEKRPSHLWQATEQWISGKKWEHTILASTLVIPASKFEAKLKLIMLLHWKCFRAIWTSGGDRKKSAQYVHPTPKRPGTYCRLGACGLNPTLFGACFLLNLTNLRLLFDVPHVGLLFGVPGVDEHIYSFLAVDRQLFQLIPLFLHRGFLLACKKLIC